MPNIHDARDTYASTLAFLVTREELPHLLNARGLFGCGVEVGVKEGYFSAHLLEHWHGRHLISVDPWREFAGDEYRDIANVPQETHEGFYQATVRRLAPYGDRSTIWRTTSLEAAERIPRHSLDFVYLDARHDYGAVLEDLGAWFEKLRPGGILSGHDYVDGHFTAGVFGVRSAVDEFLGERGIRVHATLDDEPWISWAAEIPPPQSLFAGADLESAPSSPQQEGPVEASDQVITMQFEANGAQHRVQLSLDPNQMSQRIMLDAFSHGKLYEPETSLLIARILTPGDTVVDVGGHVGFFSMLAATLVGPQGRVIGFEPEPGNFDRYSRHAEMNGFTHVEAVPMAVGETDGTTELFFNSDNDGGHALWDVGEHPFNQKSRAGQKVLSIPVTSLDGYLGARDLSGLKLIKIDAEGCEHHVLLGAKRLLQKYRVPYVVAEINDFGLQRMGTDQHALRGLMLELGYEVFALVPDTTEMVPLRPDQVVESKVVYNLLFRHETAPELQVAA